MSSNGNSNIYTKLTKYVVWREGQKPDDGTVVEAISAYGARLKHAKSLGLAGVTLIMARRADAR